MVSIALNVIRVLMSTKIMLDVNFALPISFSVFDIIENPIPYFTYFANYSQLIFNSDFNSLIGECIDYKSWNMSSWI